MGKLSIDINCDMGESYGRFQVGNDELVFPHITSCNIACGFHGGDPYTIEKTISKAIQHKVNIGAHPSYPDISGFGRRKMELKKQELKSLIKFQVAAIKGLVESQGSAITYVKPHGALYNSMVQNDDETKWVIEAIKEIDDKLMLMGLAGSHVEQISASEGISFIAEAFADRVYEPDGTLRSRNKENSVIQDPTQAANQVVSMVLEQKVICSDGSNFNLEAQSICIHGDNPMAGEILEAISKALTENNISKESFASG